MRSSFTLPLLVTLALLLATPSFACPAHSFLTPDDLASMREHHEDLVVVDARSPDDYAKGHIPGAVNLPPELWRTPKTKPGQGDSQYIFRRPDGSMDVERYERMLGEAGITRQTPVVVYGNHAGKGAGSVPAMILDMLGHEKVFFLDGVGAAQWEAAGHTLTNEPSPERPTATYEARPKAGVLWNLSEVIGSIGDDSIVFYDTRSADEFHGREMRSNARGGRIPGAVLFDYADLLDEDKTAVTHEEARSELAARGITPDKTVVLYCQTATRVSLPYLLLKDLGYPNVRVYDASWHEYGNRADTPVETDADAPAATPAAPATQPAA